MKPKLEALEERWCPDATTDTLVWNPAAGSQDGLEAANWYDQTQSLQGVTAPTATNPIILDGTKANKPIEFTAGDIVASLTVQNGYNSTLIIDQGVLNTSANDVVKNGCILVLSSKDLGGGIALSNRANFLVANGGTLKLVDGVATGAGFFQNWDGMAGEYLNNAGTVTWTGTAVAAGGQSVFDYLNTAVLNTGTFNVDGGTNGDTTKVGAVLEIQQADKNTNNVSFDQTSGSLNLKNDATVQADMGYYQSGGSLTSDSSGGGATQSCMLVAGADQKGDINIAGGTVVVDTVLNTVGTLQFFAHTAEINAEVDVAGLTLQNGKSNLSDLLDCRGVDTVTLGTDSYLNIETTGNFALGTGNQWTVMMYPSGALQNTWGRIDKPNGMTVSVGATKILVSN